jgi:hypothetical protein
MKIHAPFIGDNFGIIHKALTQLSHPEKRIVLSACYGDSHYTGGATFYFMQNFASRAGDQSPCPVFCKLPREFLRECPLYVR